ncbi:MAG: aspartate--tRNA(Asn) ligase [Candidatus Aenigmarchaeota archaeon ex4484_56]|nr:MAG: aspartate--tRNA(Asn) ligase [Candidatus Aenigmarchaeota archaeon ex4484_56]
MERVYISEIEKKDNIEVLLKGWVENKRELGKLIFLILRDAKSKIQIIVKEDSPLFEEVKKLRREYVIEVKGVTKLNDKAPNGVEIIPQSIKILNTSESPLPIEFSGKIDTDLSKRLDYRFLDLRNHKTKKIFEIKSKFLYFARKFFYEKDFIEVHTPKIVCQGAEGGSELFPILYYNKEGYLTQSPQFYKQILQSAGFEKVYEIGPIYRAEKSHTVRHLSEFFGIDCEISFINSYEDLMKLIENFIKYSLIKLGESCKEEFKFLNIDLPQIINPIPKITLKEIGKLINKECNDLSPEDEKKVGIKIKEKYNTDFVFIIDYPFEARPFYTMKKGDNLTYSFDLLFKGLEIITGSQREHNLNTLKNQAKEKNISLDSISFYLDAFKYGMPPHGGFGFGIERFIMQLLDLKNIRESSLFPRDVERLMP